MESMNMNNRNPTFWLILYTLLAFVLTSMLFSCKTKYVTTEKVVDRYIHNTDTIRDSVYNNVFINQYIKGDTIFKDKIETIYKYVYRSKVDTFIQKDSIPYIVVKEVEKKEKLTWWMRVKLWLFYPLIVAFALFIILRLPRR